MKREILLAGFLLIAGCAMHRHSGSSAAHPEKERSPERIASNALVEEGEAALNGGSYDRSGDSFREAIKVDPSNGAAYYWLAVVKVRSGEYGEVWGLIERAESLLKGDLVWGEKIEELKREAQGNKPN